MSRSRIWGTRWSEPWIQLAQRGKGTRLWPHSL